MLCVADQSADGVWRQAAELIRTRGIVQAGRDQPTREILHFAFTIEDSRQRVVFARPINPAFALVEVIWILAGLNDLQFLMPWNPRMRSYSDDSKKLHGAYGYRLGSQVALPGDAASRLRHPHDLGEARSRLDQIQSAYRALQRDPHSRQVVLQIWHAELDMPDPEARSRDVPCNLVSHIMVRDGKLEWLQVMRSNDLIWGTPYNFIQFMTIQEIMAGWLGVEVGSYNHVSDSLHVYERHWPDLDHFDTHEADVPLNIADLRVAPFEHWANLWARLVVITEVLGSATEVSSIRDTVGEARTLPPAYHEWVCVLAAETFRRRGFHDHAEEVIELAGAYWSTSWRMWRDSKRANVDLT